MCVFRRIVWKTVWLKCSSKLPDVPYANRSQCHLPSTVSHHSQSIGTESVKIQDKRTLPDLTEHIPWYLMLSGVKVSYVCTSNRKILPVMYFELNLYLTFIDFVIFIFKIWRSVLFEILTMNLYTFYVFFFSVPSLHEPYTQTIPERTPVSR